MRSAIKISKNRFVGKDQPVLIIAEISTNHGQNFNRAVSLIKEAKACGVDAVKFQTYHPDTLTIDVDNKYFRIKHPKWGGRTLYKLYRDAYMPWGWFKRLKKIADDLGIIFFSTAFDKTAVDFLEELGVSLHKISSFELVDLPLIKYMAETKKPIIMSTGMAIISEINEAVKTAKVAGTEDIILLKCTSNYPANAKEMNLKTITDMTKRYSCPIGLSDHSPGIGVAITAVSLGAKLIEKHFTLSRKYKTPDSFFSLEPEELKELVKNIRIAESALGSVSYGLTASERKSRAFRRSLFTVKDIKKGEIFNEVNIKSIRPSNGLKPKYLKRIIGKKAKHSIKRGVPLSWEKIS